MTSSPEFVSLQDLEMATIAALEFSYFFTRLRMPIVIGQLLFPVECLSTLIGSVLVFLGLRLANPKPITAPQVTQLPPEKVRRTREG